MKPRTRVLLSDCIERGLARGWHRAHKHVENPTKEAIIEQIHDCTMGEIYEWFTFEEEEY